MTDGRTDGQSILNGFRVIERKRNYHRRISKENNSKIVQTSATVLVFCTLSDNAQYFCKVSWKYLERVLSYGADTNIPLSNFKGNNTKTVWIRVTIIVFCTSLMMFYICMKFRIKYLEQFSSYRADTIAWRTHRQTDRQTDIGGKNNMSPPPPLIRGHLISQGKRTIAVRVTKILL